MNSIIQSMVEQPPLVALLVKMTILLGVAWLLHFALTRRNPRWRVFLWRGAMLGVALLPLAMWVAPKFAVKVADAPHQTNAAGVMRGSDRIKASGLNYQSELIGAGEFDFQQKKTAYVGASRRFPMLFAILAMSLFVATPDTRASRARVSAWLSATRKRSSAASLPLVHRPWNSDARS